MKNRNAGFKSELEEIRRKFVHYFKLQEENPRQSEIDEVWYNIIRRIRRGKWPLKARRIIIPATVAAAVLWGVVWLNGTKQLPPLDIKSAAARLEMPTDSVDGIKLVVSSGQVISVSSGSTVEYLADGSITVDHEKVENAEKEEEPDQYNQIIVPKGKHTSLLLADGSNLHINAGTRVLYPRSFKKERREIYVEGEVYLDVKHQNDVPFYVKTSSFEVEVLGTAFNVNAYSDDPCAEVVLLRGSVNVRGADQRVLNLQPNQLVSITNGVINGRKTVEASDYIAWTQSLLILHGDALDNVFRKLNRYYGIEIRFDPACANMPMFGKLDLNNPLKEVVQRIAIAAPISYEEEDDIISIKSKL
jgi:hypothetical protein